EFCPALIADRVPSYGWCAPAYWRDIGSPAAYREAQMDLLEGRARMLLAPAGAWDGGSWRAAGGSAASDARVVPPAVLGARVALHPRCQVGPAAVIGDGSTIGPDARVEGAILWERVEVGAGAVLRECVIGADVKIGTHARVGPGIVLESGAVIPRSEEHTSELQSPDHLVCRLLLEKKKKKNNRRRYVTCYCPHAYIIAQI